MRSRLIAECVMVWAAVVAPAACAQPSPQVGAVAASRDEPSNVRHCRWGRDGDLSEVPLSEIPAEPSAYEGQRVRVRGLGSMRIEATSVSSGGRSLWLHMASKERMLELAECSGREIVVEGTFRGGIQGHFGGWSGGLEQISFIAEPRAASAGDSISSRPVNDPRLVELSIEDEAPRPRSGSRVSIRIRLRNVSDEWLWMNYGFGVAQPGGDGPLWLNVTEPNTGKVLEWHCSDCSVPGDAPKFVLLGPNDEYSSDGRARILSPGGERERIRVVAHYRDRKQSAPAPPAYTHRFVGKLVSNALELEFPALRTAGVEQVSPSGGCLDLFLITSAKSTEASTYNPVIRNA